MKEVCGSEIIKKNFVIAAVASVIVIAVATYFLLQKPSFIISVSPSTVTIPRGSLDNVIITFDPPEIPQNLGTGFINLPAGVECPARGPKPPASFWLTLSVGENASPGSYTVGITAEDKDKGLSTSTSFTLTITSVFTVSASPDNFTISRGENQTVTLSYSPQVPSHLGTSTSISGPSPSIQLGGWIEAPFTFPVVVPADAALGTHTVTLVSTDQNTGETATTTITVNVTSA